jgi:hypothetical protein
MQQCIDRCHKHLYAKVVISSGTDYLTLNAFGSNVVDIAQEDDVTLESLLCAAPYTLSHDLQVITSVHGR